MSIFEGKEIQLFTKPFYEIYKKEIFKIKETRDNQVKKNKRNP